MAHFAIYLIPLLGMAFKARQVLQTPHSLFLIKTNNSSSEEQTKTARRLVEWYQADDLAFGLASLVESVFYLCLGFLSSSFVPFVVFSILAKTAILCSHKEGLFEGFKEQLNFKAPTETKNPTLIAKQNLQTVDHSDLLCTGVLYMLPVIGGKLKLSQTRNLKAEYLSKECSKERKETIQTIQKAYTNAFSIAKVVSLSIIFTFCTAFASQPLILLVIAVSLVTASYFSAKTEMEEEFVGNVKTWQ